MTAIPVSFIIGGPLSSLILGMDGLAGLMGWQWLFVIEGTPAILLAFLVLKLLPDGPMQAPWLSGGEKQTIAARLAGDAVSKHRQIWAVLVDPQVLALGVAYFGLFAAVYGVALWLPQIVQSMGFSNLATGFVVALPFLGAAIAMMLWGRSSDIKGERIWHVAVPLLFAALSLVVASLTSLDVVVLLALSCAVVAIYACYGPFFSLPSMFLSGSAAAVGIAFVNTIANLGAFVGPYLIGVLNERTGNYALSMAVLGGGLVMTSLIILALGQAWQLLFLSVKPIASLFVLGRTSFPPGDQTLTAFYDVAATIGGPWLKFLVTVPLALIAGIPGALAAQVATARLLFGMARDGRLPRLLAHVRTGRAVPDRAILLVAAVTLALGLLLSNQLELLTSMVNFGALTGFLMLHLSVIVHFMWRQKSTQWAQHLLVPLIGFVITAYVLLNMALPAKIAGIAWLCVRIGALIGLKLMGKRATLPA